MKVHVLTAVLGFCVANAIATSQDEEPEIINCFSCVSVPGSETQVCDDPVDVTSLKDMGAFCSQDAAKTCFKTVTRYEKHPTHEDEEPGIYTITRRNCSNNVDPDSKHFNGGDIQTVQTWCRGDFCNAAQGFGPSPLISCLTSLLLLLIIWL